MGRVLVVEDNPDLRVVLAEYLHRTFGPEVVAVESYIQARAAARSGPFCVLVLDFLMDGASALDVATEVKSIPGNEHTPVILLTAFDPKELSRSSHPHSQRMLRAVKELAADAYLVKPFDLELLKEAIERIVPTLGRDGCRREALTRGDHGGEPVC